MKDKKKVELVKRIAAGVCVLMMAVGCMGSELYYADEISDLLLPVFKENFMYHGDGPVNLPSRYTNGEYKNYMLLYDEGDWGCYFTNDDSFELETKYSTYDDGEALSLYMGYYSDCPYSRSEDNGASWHDYSSKGWQLACLYIDTLLPLREKNIFYISSCPVYVDGTLFLYGDEGTSSSSGGTYNSSLGYLQNIQRKNLTLDGENYDPDYDSWQVMFLFDSTSTKGLDITSGGYSVRHFMNWEVRDKDSNVVRTYDKVSCGEYDAASCKISYPLYSTRQAAMDECGFEALSWWESSVLGYKVYIYDYLQLVRTNEDGSVEYGGYVRIDENGYVADTLDDNFTEDSDGYLDQDVPSSSGSGSNYEDAEHDADKNASNSSDSSTDLLSQINVLTSVVKAVPELIMEVFSFLPEWCLDLVATAFSLSIMITIFKLAS